MVATLWSTLADVKAYPYARERGYLVQGRETDIIYRPEDSSNLLASSTYCQRIPLRYLTVSRWCQRWLKHDFGQDSAYAPNGLWLGRYPFAPRNFAGRKIRVLVEGDPKAGWKNVDEAFQITNQLDPARYVVNFLSYGASPKPWYRVDNRYSAVAPEAVGQVYAQNDILLKTSLLESFSYPPLEMMATGGYVVVIPNDGNLEYIQDENNCLTFASGDHARALAQIERLATDPELRQRLETTGRQTAISYNWETIEGQIVGLYS